MPDEFQLDPNLRERLNKAFQSHRILDDDDKAFMKLIKGYLHSEWRRAWGSVLRPNDGLVKRAEQYSLSRIMTPRFHFDIDDPCAVEAPTKLGTPRPSRVQPLRGQTPDNIYVWTAESLDDRFGGAVAAEFVKVLEAVREVNPAGVGPLELYFHRTAFNVEFFLYVLVAVLKSS